MSTTQKRTTICLTRERERQLIWLSDLFGENTSQVIFRAIDLLYIETSKKHPDKG